MTSAACAASSTRRACSVHASLPSMRVETTWRPAAQYSYSLIGSPPVSPAPTRCGIHATSKERRYGREIAVRAVAEDLHVRLSAHRPNRAGVQARVRRTRTGRLATRGPRQRRAHRRSGPPASRRTRRSERRADPPGVGPVLRTPRDPRRWAAVSRRAAIAMRTRADAGPDAKTRSARGTMLA